MSPIPGISGFPPLGSGRFIDALNDAGLVTAPALGLCLDFADSACVASASPAPQVMNDLSGAGYTFWNGSSNLSSSFDMQFNGTPGALSRNEHFKNTSANGGQNTQQELRGGINNPAWVEGGHKNGAAFTVAGWFWLGTSGDNRTLFATSEIFWTNDSGWAFVTSNGSLLLYGKPAGSGAQQPIASAPLAASLNAWHFVAMAVDEAGGAVRFQLDGVQQLVGPGAFSFDDTSASDGRMVIGANTAGHWSTLLNSRVAAAFGWAGVMSGPQLDLAYQVTRGRF